MKAQITAAQSALDARDAQEATLPGLLAAMQAALALADAQHDLVGSLLAGRKTLLAAPPQDPVDDLCLAVDLEFLDDEIEFARQVHARLGDGVLYAERRLNRARERVRALESDGMAAMCAWRLEQRRVSEASQT